MDNPDSSEVSKVSTPVQTPDTISPVKPLDPATIEKKANIVGQPSPISNTTEAITGQLSKFTNLIPKHEPKPARLAGDSTALWNQKLTDYELEKSKHLNPSNTPAPTVEPSSTDQTTEGDLKRAS